MLNGSLNAGVEKLSSARAIEVPVEVRRVVQNVDIVVSGRTPFDGIHQRT